MLPSDEGLASLARATLAPTSHRARDGGATTHAPAASSIAKSDGSGWTKAALSEAGVRIVGGAAALCGSRSHRQAQAGRR